MASKTTLDQINSPRDLRQLCWYFLMRSSITTHRSGCMPGLAWIQLASSQRCSTRSRDRWCGTRRAYRTIG
jgi:hypothetical protein